MKENLALREDNQRKAEEIAEYRGRERALQETLVTAQKASEEIRDAARKEAEITISDAELQAEKIVQGAHARFLRIVDDINELKRQRVQFEANVRTLVETHLKLIEAFRDPAREEAVQYIPAPEEARPRQRAQARTRRPTSRISAPSAQLRPELPDLDLERHRAAARPRSAISRRTSASTARELAARRPRGRARRAPAGAAARRAALARARACTRIIAIFTMSAAVPWIGVLMAVRSAALPQRRVPRRDLRHARARGRRASATRRSCAPPRSPARRTRFTPA